MSKRGAEKPLLDERTAYERGWKSCMYHDDSWAGYETARKRFERKAKIYKKTDALIESWEGGWNARATAVHK